MPINTLRRLSGKERTAPANRHLSFCLAFVAGAANAGGFLAVHQYTSHMTGIVSSIPDQLAAGNVGLVLAAIGGLLSFLGGAMTSAVLINWARHRDLQSEYALPLMLEAVLLLCFGLMGRYLAGQVWLFVPLTVMLLCFIMGLQNATSTKATRSEVRTTHVTGLVTDIGIELGKMLYWNRSRAKGETMYVASDHQRLRFMLILFALFICGGMMGALGFKHIGFSSTVPLAALLMVMALVPVVDDLLVQFKRYV
ncbi:MAG: putative transrane protein [Herbaspirillum sp.]|nr:putative transrane protein [Herbaspirillum sp.]